MLNNAIIAQNQLLNARKTLICNSIRIHTLADKVRPHTFGDMCNMCYSVELCLVWAFYWFG